jgi:glyoxylase-like metal-dependent hydrolase (beta-lactamase superfamily II)
VPTENIQVVSERVLGLQCFPTAGHASHHVSYLDAAGTLYAGDAAGVRIQPHMEVLPPTPPPEFDLDTWLRTLDELEEHDPRRLALIHFGIADDVGRHLDELRRRLREWVALEGVTEAEFTETVGRDVDESYERAMPFWQSYAGLERYWEKRAADS